jgi:hypothetical protein
MNDRKRALKVKERLNKLKAAEKEKVAKGKKPFYLKPSQVKAIELEERCVLVMLDELY